MHSSIKRLGAALLCGGLALSLAACSATPPSTPTASPSAPTTISPPPSSPVSQTEEPTSTPTLEPVSPAYEFGTPLEETEPVEDDSFFDNTVFLGDSRTEGLQLFSGLYNGTFYWTRGMTVFRVDDPDYSIFELDGQSYTMIGALRRKQYDAVYIMMGVNELGYPASSYEQGLGKFIDLVLEAQPDAVVYLQTMPPINDAIARKNGLASYINNDQLTLFNEAIVRVAAEKKVVLLNTAEVYRDADGQLIAELAGDGCHFTYDGYTPWADYLRCHVMDADRYHFNRAAAEADASGEAAE